MLRIHSACCTPHLTLDLKKTAQEIPSSFGLPVTLLIFLLSSFLEFRFNSGFLIVQECVKFLNWMIVPSSRGMALRDHQFKSAALRAQMNQSLYLEGTAR